MAGGGGDSGGTLSKGKSAEFGTFLPRRSMPEDSSFDITAMIDLVFMMNIFFLVTSLTKSAAEADLPPARYCTPADEKDCTIIMLRSGQNDGAPIVSVFGESGEQKLTPEEYEERIRAVVEQGVEQNKKKVLIKAEKKVLVGHVARVSALATSVEGVEPLFGVVELDQKGN